MVLKMNFKIAAALALMKLLLCAQCVEHICQSGQDHCDIIENPKPVQNNIEGTNFSLFDLSDENLNLSVKWPYGVTHNASVLSSPKIVSFMEEKINSHGSSLPIRNIVEKDINEQDFLSALGLKLSSLSRPFNAARGPTASSECRQHTKLFIESLKNVELWALKMHDSSARLSSGVLNGNINQFGDFDQCLSIQGPSKELQGQYCLAYMQPVASKQSKYLKYLVNLVQSYEAFKSEFYDPGHRVPRFSSINWGLCIPSTCTPEDVEYSLREYVNELTFGTGITLQVRVEPSMCQIKKDLELDFRTKMVLGFFTTVILIAIISTIYDFNTRKENQNEWLTAFSLRKNIKWLFSTKASPGDIGTVHGIRFVNAMCLLLSHKSLALFYTPYINRTDMSESLGKSWTVVGRAASLYTDPFLLFSGMLTSYSLFGRLERNQRISFRNEYGSRLLRIVPTLGALILFCTYILPWISTGPLWNLVVSHHATLCKKNWWRNLLFIHNYFGFSNMCLTHTHHLGIDTQLFALSPLMVLGLWKWPKKGFVCLTFLAGMATAARFYTTIVYQLSNYIYFGTTIQRLFKTADYMYSSPPHRSTVYILGVLLGYALRKFNGAKLSKRQLRYGWTFAIICYFGTMLGPAPMGDINYKYNPLHAAIYAAFAPIGWCAYFSWIVFVSHLGYKNSFTNFLSWRGFQIATKLSYSIYLTQFPVFFFNVGRRRHADYYSFLPLMFDLNEYICIIAASVILTLLFDAPFQNLKKVFFKSSPSSSNPTTAKVYTKLE